MKWNAFLKSKRFGQNVTEILKCLYISNLTIIIMDLKL
jgi:hypothetical protein